MENEGLPILIYSIGEKKIQAVKGVRKLTAWGLKEAKDAVDWASREGQQSIIRIRPGLYLDDVENEFDDLEGFTWTNTFNVEELAPGVKDFSLINKPVDQTIGFWKARCEELQAEMRDLKVDMTLQDKEIKALKINLARKEVVMNAIEYAGSRSAAHDLFVCLNKNANIIFLSDMAAMLNDD